MTIVSSIVLFDSLQIDGRRWIEERHTDHLDIPHYTRYLADADHDTSSSLSANAALWEAVLAEAEIEQNEEEIVG